MLCSSHLTSSVCKPKNDIWKKKQQELISRYLLFIYKASFGWMLYMPNRKDAPFRCSSLPWVFCPSILTMFESANDEPSITHWFSGPFYFRMLPFLFLPLLSIFICYAFFLSLGRSLGDSLLHMHSIPSFHHSVSRLVLFLQVLHHHRQQQGKQVRREEREGRERRRCEYRWDERDEMSYEQKDYTDRTTRQGVRDLKSFASKHIPFFQLRGAMNIVSIFLFSPALCQLLISIEQKFSTGWLPCIAVLVL